MQRIPQNFLRGHMPKPIFLSKSPNLNLVFLIKGNTTILHLTITFCLLSPQYMYLQGSFSCLDELSVQYDSLSLQFHWWDVFKKKIESMNHWQVQCCRAVLFFSWIPRFSKVLSSHSKMLQALTCEYFGSESQGHSWFSPSETGKFSPAYSHRTKVVKGTCTRTRFNLIPQ